jgi:hypothetical protein
LLRSFRLGWFILGPLHPITENETQNLTVGICSHCNSKSIREGIFPSKLKKPVVKPIYKNGEEEEAINYWPITLVPALSKVLEKVIANQLIAFLEKRDILINLSLDLGKMNV